MYWAGRPVGKEDATRLSVELSDDEELLVLRCTIRQRMRDL